MGAAGPSPTVQQQLRGSALPSGPAALQDMGSCGLGKEGGKAHVETAKFFLQRCLHFHPRAYAVLFFNLMESTPVLRVLCSLQSPMSSFFFNILSGSALLVILIKVMVINMRVFMKAQ